MISRRVLDGPGGGSVSKINITPIEAVRFITSCLLPPPKKAVLAALGIPLAISEASHLDPAKDMFRCDLGLLEAAVSNGNTTRLQGQLLQTHVFCLYLIVSIIFSSTLLVFSSLSVRI
jgi:hypothetical protein